MEASLGIVLRIARSGLVGNVALRADNRGLFTLAPTGYI